MLKFRKTTEVLEEVETDVTITEEVEKKVPEEDSEEENQVIEETEVVVEEVDFLHLTSPKEEVVLTEVLLTEAQTETHQEEILRGETHQDALHLQEEEALIRVQNVQEEAKK